MLISSIYEQLLDDFIYRIDIHYSSAKEFLSKLNPILLESSYKPILIKKIDNMASNVNDFKDWEEFEKLLDFSVRYDLVETKEKLGNFFINSIGQRSGGSYHSTDGCVYKKIKETLMRGEPMVWPNNLKRLSLMGLHLDLETLDLKTVKITDFNGLNLKSLELRNMAIDDEGLELLVRQFPNLVDLLISSTPHITDRGLLALIKLPLHKLSLSFCRSLTREGCITFLEKLHTLEEARYLELFLNNNQIK